MIDDVDGQSDLLPTFVNDASDQSMYARWDEARERCPVIKVKQHGRTYRQVMRYDLVKEITLDPKTFSSAPPGVDGKEYPVHGSRTIPLMVDPPEHTQYRNLLQDRFSISAIKALEPFMRDTARTLVERIAPRGQCEFLADFARPYPGAMFAKLMGLPLEDVDALNEMEKKVYVPPEHDPDGEAYRRGADELKNYIKRQMSRLREQPDDSVISHLMQTEMDGRKLRDDEVEQYTLLICLAGLHTTTNALGKAVLHLANHPDEQRRLRSETNLIPGFLEEIARVYSAGWSYRYATKDGEIGGERYCAGDMFGLMWGAANRDPRVFNDPADVKPERRPNAHLQFGFGTHRCMGIYLAKADMRVGLEEWLRQVPQFELAPGAVLEEQVWGGVGLLSLPLVWDI